MKTVKLQFIILFFSKKSIFIVVRICFVHYLWIPSLLPNTSKEIKKIMENQIAHFHFIDLTLQYWRWV